jgi:glutamate N-acetyltransferase / amino-acid N-acetyltransferase
MAVGLDPKNKLLPVAGILLSATSAGIYKKSRDDVVLIKFPGNSSVSAVFTKNSFAAAPVKVAQSHLRSNQHQQYCLINSGNANAGMGQKGILDTLNTCTKLAELTTCSVESILPFSTGVIGVDLPVDDIKKSIPGLIKLLEEENWDVCAKAILTTDTVSKGISKQCKLNGKTITITAIAKGSGMIRPDMATMLAFIGTDAEIEKSLLDKILLDVTNKSFNKICVDGDMSTNDACIIIATGESGIRILNNTDNENYNIFTEAISDVCIYLAKSIVRDGEGASKFVTIKICGGNSSQECLLVAYSIAKSPLVKTAIFASDPNWGRILAAIGYSGIFNLDVSIINIYINDYCIVKDGSRDKAYSEKVAAQLMLNDEINLTIELNRGDCQETVWTCDFSYDYVRINAEYRS